MKDLLLGIRDQVLSWSQDQRSGSDLDGKVARGLGSELGEAGAGVGLASGGTQELVVGRGRDVDEGSAGIDDS